MTIPSNYIFKLYLLIVFLPQFANFYNNTLVPIVTDVKYFFIFFNSALNPMVYGYGNETMQKAFRLTFPFIFKEKVQ